MDWIRLEKRLAIYLRDEFRCMWCQLLHLDELGYGLHLDHIHDGEYNDPRNLVTSCHRCNSSRQTLGLPEWLEKLEKRHGEPHAHIALRVLTLTGRALDLVRGRELAAKRRPASVASEIAERRESRSACDSTVGLEPDLDQVPVGRSLHRDPVEDAAGESPGLDTVTVPWCG